MNFFDQADHSHLRFFFSLPASLSLRISWAKNLTWFYVFVCVFPQTVLCLVHHRFVLS